MSFASFDGLLPSEAALRGARSSAARLLDLGWGERMPHLADPGVLHDLFAAQVAAAGQRVAVEHGAARLTYAELDARAERLAAGLRGRGARPGVLVALQMPRSIDVYVAMLGVLKSGAAYVPIDAEWPRERVAFVLADSGVALLLTSGGLRHGEEGLPCPVIDLGDDWDRVLPPSPADAQRPAASPEDPCYVIYTSGSTGTPKGVLVAHRSAVHLVRAEQHLFGVGPHDRVLQGFSPSFDAAVEEIWLAFAAGAALVVATKNDLLSDLARFLTEARVSVFSTIPTLLATVDAPLPTVRTLILGGEACPQVLADRWATGGRRVFNTYGPTEATVIATCARLHAGRAVTIGRPIPNYFVCLVDEAGELVAEGATGEIAIGGVGLARGYLGKPELTAARFVPCAFAGEGGAPRVLYRTGDLGRYDARGDIVFSGRADDQVKVRGFRVELGEIEAALHADPAVVQASVVVREDLSGARELVAYVVLRPGGSLDEIVERLRGRLPPYMVPAHVERMGELPTLASGKVDKRSLPPPATRSSRRPLGEGDAPQGEAERAIARVWTEVFGVSSVRRDDHFFRDLGGHSLLVAKAVSALRREPAFAALSVVDLYDAPTVRDLALRAARSLPAQVELSSPRARPWAFYACGAAQLGGLYVLFGVHSLQWLAPYLTYAWVLRGGLGVARSLLAAVGVLFAVYPLMLVLAALAKWTLIGRYRPGRHPLWSAYYLRFWLVERVLALAPTGLLVGTPLLAAYYRLLGARVGRGAHFASDSMGCFDLVAVGEDAAIGVDADLSGAVVEGGELVLGRIDVGARCTVGARSVLAPDTGLGDDASLAELSLLPAGTRVPARERWAGSPATRAGLADDSPVPRPAALQRLARAAAYALCVLVSPAFVVLALLPGVALFYGLEHRVGAWAVAASPLVAAQFIVLLCLEIVAAKWLLVGRVRPGRYPLFGAFVLRKWLFDRAIQQSLDVLGGMYATLFLNPWLRALGSRVGPNAEISTASMLAPDLVDIGEGAFVADCVSLGAPEVSRGYVRYEGVKVGARSFVGNSAVVPGGGALGDDTLLGCLSAAPRAADAGSAWFGSPAIALPQRQASPAFPEETTYRPTRALVVQRFLIEALRVTLPTTCLVALTWVVLHAALALSRRLPIPAVVAVFPLVMVGVGVAAAAFVVAFKWAVVGRYRSGERPLWSTFVWRNELVTAMHENLADPLLNELLEGTPYLAWFFRAMGASVGRRVYMGTTELTEYDLVSVGDEASLNAECTLQTHLFEDRIMKMSKVEIGARCTVGSDAVVLYDTRMEAGSALAPLSLLMKGESLPAGTRWVGSPARPAVRTEER